MTVTVHLKRQWLEEEISAGVLEIQVNMDHHQHQREEEVNQTMDQLLNNSVVLHSPVLGRLSSFPSELHFQPLLYVIMDLPQLVLPIAYLE